MFILLLKEKNKVCLYSTCTATKFFWVCMNVIVNLQKDEKKRDFFVCMCEETGGMLKSVSATTLIWI